MAEDRQTFRNRWAGFLVPAGLFIGMSIGFIFDQLVAGRSSDWA